MNLKPIKTIKTSCPFPLLKYDAKISYNKVQKASGIAYIILELIQKSPDGSEKITDVLKRFGIPYDLYYIFAEEIHSLIEKGILMTDINPSYVKSAKHFEEMKLNYFKLTPDGRKMFAEGFIPSSEKGKKNVAVTYSPVTRRFALETAKNSPKIETSFLGGDFISRVHYDVSGMEEYLNSVKNHASVGIKNEEMIISVDPGEAAVHLAPKKENLEINIYDDGVEFALATTDETVFFNEYFSADLMSKGMLVKDKYKFDFTVPSVIWDASEISGIYIPDDIKFCINQKCRVFLSRGNTPMVCNKSDLSFTGDEALLNMLDEKAEFALLDNNGCKYYVPCNVAFNCKNFDGVFTIQLLLEKNARQEGFISVVRELASDGYEAEFSDSGAKVISYVAEALNDYEYLNGYSNKKLSECKSDEERISLLIKLNSAFLKHNEWIPCFSSLSKELFTRYTESTDLENVAFKNTILTPLRKAMNMPKSEYISALANPLSKKESAELVYQALEGADFSESEILAIVNVIERYSAYVLSRSPIDKTNEIARKFALLNSNLWKLCDMLGVEDPNDYTLRDDYNADDFLDAFATYRTANESIKKYEAYAKANYAQLKRIEAIITPVQELIAIERTASEHPENITRKFIDEQISRAKYSVAISNLLIKAQYDLRILIGDDAKKEADKIIEQAYVHGIINEKAKDLLHRLRICRNGLQHPESKKSEPYNKQIVEEWRDTVFSLKGEQN